MSMLTRAWWWVLDVLFPTACSGCGASGEVLCVKCQREIVACSDELFYKEFRIYVACKGNQVLRKVIHRFKYRYCEQLAHTLAKLLVQRLCALDMRNVWIVPVPLFWKRERERGFNQSAMLAGIVSERLGVKCVGLLERCRETAVQALLNKTERAENVREAFLVRTDRLCHEAELTGTLPKRIFVLDDVITSGATFLECARVLRAAGVEEVYGIMLSHGL